MIPCLCDNNMLVLLLTVSRPRPSLDRVLIDPFLIINSPSCLFFRVGKMLGTLSPISHSPPYPFNAARRLDLSASTSGR